MVTIASFVDPPPPLDGALDAGFRLPKRFMARPPAQRDKAPLSSVKKKSSMASFAFFLAAFAFTPHGRNIAWKRARAARAGAAMELVSSDTNFVTWASIKSASSLSKVELATFEPLGLRGLRATRPLAPRDESISWPASLALQVTTGMRTPVGVSKPLWTAAQWYTRLALLLLLEKAEGAASELAPWLDALPRTFDTPYSWPDAEVDALHYPQLGDAVRRQRAEWAQIHADLEASGFGCSRAQLEWALHNVRSRAFSGAYEGSTYEQRIGLFGFISLLTIIYPLIGAGSWSQSLTGAASALIFLVARDIATPKVLGLRRYVLCPLIDMLNHDGTISSDVAYRVFTNQFCVTSVRAVGERGEVRISYGPRSNDQLLQYHGFVERECVHDAYVMPRFLQHVDAYASVSDGALDRLQTDGVLEPLRKGVRLDRLGNADQESLRLVERLAEAIGGGKSVAELLLAACRLEQQAQPTTLAQDVDQLAQLGSAAAPAKPSGAKKAGGSARGFDPAAVDNSRLRTILQFRAAKKAILARAIAALN